jgi:Lrp/AsnC family transcriptional regulator for asnA, asnC and gidA
VPEADRAYAAPVDDVDLEILRHLSADARLSGRALARAIGMSPGAVAERVARLEASGVIRGYHADVDPAALGYRMQVVIGLQTEQGPEVDEAIRALMAMPEVVAVHVVTGQWDLLVVVQVRDHHHLRDVVLREIWAVAGFRHSESMLVLDSHAGTRWPLDPV